MAYTPRHYYRGKDDLDRGDPNKRVKGAELSDEFEAISSDLRKKEGEINDLIQNGGGSGGGSGGPVGWHEITGKPSTYPPSAHDHDADYAPINHNHDADYAPIGHDHAMDDLSDVNAGTPARDDFLVWNGSSWVATDLSIIETELRFKGGIDMTGAAPSNPENGDLYVNNTAGEIDSSWGVIAGTQVLEGKFVGYGADAGRWFLLGDMAQAGVSSVSPGLGIDVDDSVPAEPVVSIDRVEVDKWYAAKDHDHDGDYLKDYTETDPVFSAHVSSGITQTDIDQWNAAASGTAPVVSVNAKTGAVVLDHTDVGAAKDDHTHDSDYADINHDHDLLYAGINHSHDLDDLSDVNTGNPTRDDLLIWNGSNWIADDFAFIETSLRFKGGIDMTGAAPSNPENGDLYINNTAGVIDASWGVLAGTNVNEGKFVGWAEAKGRWYLLGDMADVGVTKVSPGLGIDVDDSKPSEPVVSIDRDEVDKWYASTDDILWKQNGDDIYYNDGNVGIGTGAPAAKFQVGNPLGADAGIRVYNDATNKNVSIDAGFVSTGVNGTESNPALILGGDVNTGVFHPAADTLAVSTNGTERMRIDSNGNVGIGELSPDRKLHVKDINIGVASFESTDTSSKIYFSDSGTTNSYSVALGSESNDMVFYASSGGAEHMRIDDSGRVGIGGTPGTRSTKEIEAEAESTLARWKSQLDDRLRAEPKADKKAVTLEITGHDKMPTKAELVERLTERNIGGGTAKLQVVGDGYFSGKMISEVSTPGSAAFSKYINDLGSAGYAALFGSTYSVPVLRDTFGLKTDGTTPLTFAVGNNLYQKIYSDGAVVFAHGGAKIPAAGTAMLQVAGDGYFSGTIYGKVADVPDHVKAITPTQIANWDAGTGGGGGGATTDGRISDDQIVHWDQAYSWGNHASAGYQPAGSYLTSIAAGNGTKVTGNKVEMSGSYTGTFTATGDVVAYSDQRLKDNVNTLDGSKVFEMRGVSFDKDGKAGSGVIAQELQKVAPELVHDDGEYLGVAYGNLVGYLIEAVKELKAEIEVLKRG